jgi:hypothetical protein
MLRLLSGPKLFPNDQPLGTVMPRYLNFLIGSSDQPLGTDMPRYLNCLNGANNQALSTVIP